MRRGEALGLRWADVDLDAGRARIVSGHHPDEKHGLHRRAEDGQRSASDIPRSGDRRCAPGPPSSDATGASLGRYRLQGPRPRIPPARRLVASSRRRERRLSSAESARYGLPRLTLKGLRHTWATLALEQGIHPRVVQERLGHSTIAITLGIYSHVSPTLHDEAADLITGLVLTSSGRPSSGT